MERNKISVIMQRIAVALYGLFIVEELISNYALFARNFTLQNWTLTHLANFLIICCASVFGVYLYSSSKTPSVFLKKAVISSSCLIILYNIISYSAQGFLINQSLSMLIPSLAGKLSAQLFVVALRLLIIILAAFFVISAVDEQQAGIKEKQEAEEDGKAEEDEEDTVETETERTRRLN